MDNWEEDFNWMGDGEPTPKAKKPSPLETVRPFERPMTAQPNDRMVAEDELGNKIYETDTGQRYTIRPATAEESRTTRAKVEDWIDEGAPLPSGEQVLEALKQMPKAAYESAASAVRGTGTVGDALGIIPVTGAVGAASRIGQAADPSVISAMGATHRVPSYKTKDPSAQQSLVHGEYRDLPNKIWFSDPLAEIILEMEVPNNGLKGSQLIKELQDNPTVRNSQLRSEDWLEAIDPQKRYTKQEIQDLVEGKGWFTFASPAKKYSSHQRQYNLVDQEVQNSYGGTNYVEYAIQSAPNYDQKGFKAYSQHYTDDTVAHVRLSERLSGNEGYVLIEELQSDLLQQGFVKPGQNWDKLKEDYLKTVEDPVRYEFMRGLTEKDLEIYNTPTGELSEEVVSGYFKGDVNNFNNFYETILSRQGLENTAVNREEVSAALDQLDSDIGVSSKAVLPPVAKTEETVRLGIQAAMAHAYNKGMTKVVIPPFDEIVNKRFKRGSGEFNEAMDPKSGFYATYVKGVQKVLRNMQEEFGDKIRVASRDMEYDPNKKENDFGIWEPDTDLGWVPRDPQEMFFQERFRNFFSDEVERLNVGVSRVFGRKAFQKLDEIGEKIANKGDRDVSEVLSEEEELFFTAFKYALWETYGNVNLISAFREVAENQIPLSQAFFNQITPKPKLKTEIKQGIEIDFQGLVDQGYDLTRPRFAEGGMVENIDPISGNPVPPGAAPKEVRDDVPIMASEGEYVIPANVVRYLGLERIEKLVSSAKQKLEELDAAGRIGGKQEDDDLPFAPEELMTKDTTPLPVGGPPMMNEGGLVTGWDSVLGQNQEAVDPITGLPLWLTTMQRQNETAAAQPAPPPPRPVQQNAPQFVQNAVQPVDQKDDKPEPVRAGTAQRMNQWSADDFASYVDQRQGMGARLAQGIATLSPLGVIGGGLVNRARRSTDERAAEAMQGMIETGKDLQGNPLSTAQLDKLRSGLKTMEENPIRGGVGISGAARNIAENVGLIRPREGEKPRESLIDRAIDFITGRSTSATTTTPIVTPRTVRPFAPSSTASSSRPAPKSTASTSSTTWYDSPGANRDDDDGALAPSSSPRPKANPTRSSSSSSSSSKSSSSSPSKSSASSGSSSKSTSSSNPASAGGKVGNPRGGR